MVHNPALDLAEARLFQEASQFDLGEAQPRVRIQLTGLLETVILDLKKHGFEQARELYADTWLGFSEVELRGFLEQARFRKVQSWIVDHEKQAPAFETILALGEK